MTPSRLPLQAWCLAPVLAVLALGLSAYWWQASKATWQPPPPLQPELPTFSAPASLQAAAMQHAQERPLLWVSRRPQQEETTAAGASETVDALGQARLVAVFASGTHQRVAVLQQADGSKLKITEQSAPWRIESFDGRTAVFLSEANVRLERPLEQPGAGAAARQAPAAANANAARPPGPSPRPVPAQPNMVLRSRT